MQKRHLTRPFKVKEVSDDGTIEGYGSVFGVLDSYRDIVVKGAFRESIKMHREKGSSPALLWQHDSKSPIGVWEYLEEDDHGLMMRGKLALGTQKGREAYELLKMKAVNGLSIGFSVPKGGEEYNEKENVNHLKQVDLWETSVVTFPANQDAQVTGVRSDIENPRKFEQLLRDVGLTQNQAKSLMSGGYKAMLGRRDVEDSEALKAANNLLHIMRN